MYSVYEAPAARLGFWNEVSRMTRFTFTRRAWIGCAAVLLLSLLYTTGTAPAGVADRALLSTPRPSLSFLPAAKLWLSLSVFVLAGLQPGGVRAAPAETPPQSPQIPRGLRRYARFVEVPLHQGAYLRWPGHRRVVLVLVTLWGLLAVPAGSWVGAGAGAWLDHGGHWWGWQGWGWGIWADPNLLWGLGGGGVGLVGLVLLALSFPRRERRRAAVLRYNRDLLRAGWQSHAGSLPPVAETPAWQACNRAVDRSQAQAGYTFRFNEYHRFDSAAAAAGEDLLLHLWQLLPTPRPVLLAWRQQFPARSWRWSLLAGLLGVFCLTVWAGAILADPQRIEDSPG